MGEKREAYCNNHLPENTHSFKICLTLSYPVLARNMVNKVSIFDDIDNGLIHIV